MRRLIAFALLLLAPLAFGQGAFYWNLFSVDFLAYSNGNLAGNSNWVAQNGHVTAVVAGNTIQCSSIGSTDCGNIFSTTYPNDQCSQIKVTTLNAVSSATIEIGVRASTSANTYYAAFVKGPLGSSAQVLIGKVIAGTFTQLVAFTTETINSGDLVGFCAQGTTLYTTIRGSLVSALTTTDSSIASGVPQIGIQSNGQAQTDVVLGYWSGFYIGTTIASTGGGGGSMTVKWNPGHYIITDQRPDTVSNVSAQITQALNDADGAFVSATQRIQGVQVEPQWFQLETPSGGCYYFDPSGGCYQSGNPIDVALSLAASKSASRSTACGCSVDYKVIIYLSGQEALAIGMPTIPQATPYGTGTATKSLAPDYVYSAGCVFNGYYNYQELRFWNSTCMGYYIALANKLGAVYDSNPHVEMIVPIYETAVNASQCPMGSSCTDATYTVAAATTQLQNLATAMVSSWPTTQKVLFNNYGYIYGSSTMTSTQLNTITTNWVTNTSAASNNGMALGGPDILSGSYCCSTGDQISRGVVGSVNYLGKVGLLWEEQANCFNWTSQTISATETYAYGTLGATHEAWADIQTGEGAPCTWAYWSAVKTYLQGVSFRINSTRPSSYTWNLPAANDDDFRLRDGRRAAA